MALTLAAHEAGEQVARALQLVIDTTPSRRTTPDRWRWRMRRPSGAQESSWPGAANPRGGRCATSRRPRTFSSADPLPSQGGSQRRASAGNADGLLAGTFRVSGRERVSRARPRLVSRDVARARECPPVPKCTRLVPATRHDLAITDNTRRPFAGLFLEPSDGLEPSTPSLPWRSKGSTGVHGWTSPSTIFLQIDASRCVARARACPRVPRLMYPPRTRGVLSVL
jgi:hypothetical protein